MKNLYKDIVYYFSLLGYLGFVMVFNILFFIIIYKIIEKYFFSSDLLFITFTLIGIFSGFYNSYKLIMKKK
ncbi:AtpZ/AtpI family protein [Ilyobacter polytropus]|jgi:F0F1-type ATP synthase assembly protein I|uniref:AtpZ/AtpI family protein n=1 Tax=Ilyobacter polytropus TaxID=167642 RepID=UPI0003183B0C